MHTSRSQPSWLVQKPPSERPTNLVSMLPPRYSILHLHSNHPIKIDWADSPVAQAAIENELGPVDKTIEYSIFVRDPAAMSPTLTS